MKAHRAAPPVAGASKLSLLSLPSGIFLKIIQHLEDAKSVFFLLDARGSDTRGPLEQHLWLLSQAVPHAALWPVLHLDTKHWTRLQSLSLLEHVEATMHLFGHIVVDESTDVTWLHHHRVVHTTFTWTDVPQPNDTTTTDIQRWYFDWATSFRVTQLAVWPGDDEKMPAFLAVLPHLDSLTHLDMCVHVMPLLTPLFEWLPTSSVVDFKVMGTSDFYGVESHLTTHMVNCLRMWVETRPARHLTLHCCSWQDKNSAIIQASLHEMLHCPTMESLDLHGFDLPTSAWSMPPTFPPSLTSLAMDNCRGLSSSRLIEMAAALVGSNVARLSLHGTEDDDDDDAYEDGMLVLLETLPRTNVTTLDLSNRFKLVTKLVQVGSSLAAHHRLETLVLKSFRLTDTFAIELALALQYHPSLRHLHVDYMGEMSAQGLRAVMAIPNLQTLHVRLRSSGSMTRIEAEKTLVESLAQEVGVELELTRW
ncbi:Aste57867_19736 [Aphanomyces stellatus]|uniref:Aste57867_19736 protein n=1 Tax=Aphanomyces stellatus TaxID=120398 RepID=A0A485LD40_9STRA|nr:hypothetical protein As57867_019671 [Aphanomyces stellatus]VFT96434.1 Aste57867_19736 [Aphanomyces stellatus]